MRNVAAIVAVALISSLCQIVLSDDKDKQSSSYGAGVKLHLWVDQELSNAFYVTLNCDLVPPIASKVTQRKYYCNDEEVVTDSSKGITVFGNSLTLSRIHNRTLVGDYYCQAQIENLRDIASNHIVWTTDYVATTEAPQITNTTGVKMSMIFHLDGKFTSDNIEIFDDVSFTCKIEPPTVKIAERKWLLNGTQLFSNSSAGILLLDSTLELPRIEPKSIGVYTCEIRTIDNVTLKSDPIPIRSIKQTFFGNITYKDERISNLYVALGQNVKLNRIKEFDNVYLTCSIKPDMKNIRSVTWLHNRTTLNQTQDVDILYTSSILVLPRIRHRSAGRYVCVVHTARGFTHRSNTMTLEIKNDPSNGADSANNPLVIAELVDLPDLIEIGDDVDFDCKIYPNTTKIRRITWFREDQKLDPEVDRNIIYYNQSLKILQVGKAYLGQYKCKIETDDANITSIPASLSHINEKFQGIMVNTSGRIPFMGIPTLVAKLGHTAQLNKIREGDDLYMTCEPQPDGVSISTITWYHNGTEIIPSNRPKIDILFGNYTLVLLNVGKNATGKYTCRGLTDHGFPTPAYSVIIDRIRGPFRNRTSSTNVTVIAELLDYPDFIFEEEELYFYCNIYPHETRVDDLKWIRDGEILTNQSFLSTSLNKRTLMVHALKKTDAGNYGCRVTTGNTTITSNIVPLKKITTRNVLPYYKNLDYAVLTMERGDPSQIGHVHVGDSVYFTCSIAPKSTPIFKIKWIRDYTVILPSLQDGIVCNHGNRTLILHNVKKSQAGNYYCVGETKKGDLVSNDAYLEVLDPPTV